MTWTGWIIPSCSNTPFGFLVAWCGHEPSKKLHLCICQFVWLWPGAVGQQLCREDVAPELVQRISGSVASYL